MSYRVRNILIAAALAAVAGLLTLFYVTNYKKSVQKEQETVSVLVATKDIAAGTPGSDVVGGSYLQRREIAREDVVPGAISSPAQVRGLVATQPVFVGEQVTTSRFGPTSALGIRSQLKGTLRAIQIAGDENQVLAGTLRPGDKIDLLANIKYKVSDVVKTGPDTNDVDRVASRVVLRDIKVLKTSSSGEGAKIGETSGHTWVVLAITDTQAPKLFFTIKNGDWTLQLRPTIHPADSPNSVETIETVLGDGLRLTQFRTLYAGRSVQ